MNEIITHNLNILKDLKRGEKLVVDDRKIIKDERYVQGVRRYSDGSSRNDLIYPITFTYFTIFSLFQ